MAFDLQLKGAWARLEGLLKTRKQDIDAAIDRTAQVTAREFLRRVKAGIVSQAPGGQQFAPLKESTLKRRKYPKYGLPAIEGTDALLARRDMYNAFQIRRDGKSWSVGIFANQLGQEGQKLAIVAKVHELGATVVQTNPDGSVRVINIVGRPYIYPIMREIVQDIDAVRAAAAKELNKAFKLDD
jgi:hypothetical protein